MEGGKSRLTEENIDIGYLEQLAKPTIILIDRTDYYTIFDIDNTTLRREIFIVYIWLSLW